MARLLLRAGTPAPGQTPRTPKLVSSPAPASTVLPVPSCLVMGLEVPFLQVHPDSSSAGPRCVVFLGARDSRLG